MEEVIGEPAHEWKEYADSAVTLRLYNNVRSQLPPMRTPSPSSNLKNML